MNEQTKGIQVYEDQPRYGMQVADGWKEAWNFDTKRKGVVDSEGNFHHTLPLNGWRERSLAESVTGERNGQMWREPGKTMVVSIHHLLELPAFDQFYYDVLRDIYYIKKVVRIEVVVVDPTYGSHVVVLPV